MWVGFVEEESLFSALVPLLLYFTFSNFSSESHIYNFSLDSWIMSVTISSPAVGSFYGSRSTRVVSLSRARVIMAVQSNFTAVAPILTKLKSDCATPLPVLRHVAEAMAEDMRAGLVVDGGSDLKMILSYVDALPTGYAILGTSDDKPSL